MKLFRRTIAAVLAVSAMSLCSVPSRGDQYYGSTSPRTIGTGSESVTIKDSLLGSESGNSFYTNYQTTLGTSTNGGRTVNNQVTYSTFCVDLTHSASNSFNPLATTGPPPLVSSYQGSAINPETISNSSLGYAAWLANTYNSSATTADQQAGLQIAIWKVLCETTETGAGIENLASGSIQFSGNAAAISDAITYVTDWVSQGKQSSSAYLVNYASTDGNLNDHAQYQLIATVPTPEPSTLAIACLGVIGFVGYGLKRRRRRA